MNSRERLYARLAGEPVDKIPNLNIYMYIVAREAGVSYREFVQNYRKLAEGNLICAEKFGADHVCVISDPMREAFAYGMDVTFPEDGVPYAKQPLITDDFDLSVLKRYDPLESPHTLDRVKGCELLRQKVGRDYPVIGWIEGCIAEAADLRGLNGLLEDLALEESYLDDLFEILFIQQKRFAKAQIDAGADIIGVGNAAASLIGPNIYKKYGLGRDKAIIDYIHSLGARVKLHICGNTTPILQLLREAGPDILDIDWMVDFAFAVKLFEGSKTAISGNVDPVAVLMQGTPGYVESQIKRCINAGSSTTCIAAGCEVPAATPDENLFLMDRLLYTAT
jgi:uroporphyrinogen decarboxylase